jgi:hypothetical protein
VTAFERVAGNAIYTSDEARERADVLLRMYEGALSGVSAAAAHMRLLREAAGIDPAQWEALDVPGREYVLAQGRRLLVRAARVSASTWRELPPHSPERAAVLLKGARALHIETDWTGWGSS